MRRFFISPERVQGDRITLDSSESHHLKGVLRLEIGDEVTAFDGQGNEWACRVEGLFVSGVELRILEHHHVFIDTERNMIYSIIGSLLRGEERLFLFIGGAACHKIR